MNIQFLGATGTVTGSKYLVTEGHKKVLIDCGIFQGLKELRLRNWEKLPFNPRDIDAVILTHAHIDHSGYIPLLVRNGFTGKIYCSHRTKDLCDILLPDSGHLHEEDALFANKHKFSKHKNALPLYTKLDAENSLHHFKAIESDQKVDLGDNITFFLQPAGHILGASIIHITNGKTSLVFTGDLGRPHDLVIKTPSLIEKADYLVIESTYGDRLHSSEDPKDELEEVVNRTVNRGGTIIIPAFAVGRTQAILYLLYLLKKEKRIPDIPIYMDSPMAITVTKLYKNHPEDHRLSSEEFEQMAKEIIVARTQDESKALDAQIFPKIIVSASGMAAGGRVLHHLKVFLPDERNTILFAGFQAMGTRGSAMVNGAETVKIHGQPIPVQAEISVLHNLSAHVDYQEMLAWLKNFKNPPRKTFITHGEPPQSESLGKKIEETLRWSCHIPKYLEKIELP